jgi:Holliday junction DNA helicase RuvB
MFANFIGNDTAKEMVQIGIIAAKKKGDKVPNYIFSGHAGSGKTMLAKMVAKEANAHAEYLNASTINNTKEIIQVIRKAINAFNSDKRFDRVIIICDEAHAFKKQCEDFLLTCISENIVPIKENGEVVNYPIERENKKGNMFLSWIFISNRCGEIAQALRTRFIQVEFIKYTESEKIFIAKNYFLEKHIKAPEKICKILANRAYNIRQLKQFVDEFYDYMIARDMTKAHSCDIEKYFDLIGIDKNGLGNLDKEYIRILKESSNKASIQTIASKLCLGIKDVQELIEPKLLGLGFIEINQNGRLLTKKSGEENEKAFAIR